MLQAGACPRLECKSLCVQDALTSNCLWHTSKTASKSNNRDFVRKGLQASLSIMEALPLELKLRILCQIPDTRTLSAIVHASPSYHQVYSRTRKKCLIAILAHQLGEEVLADAVLTSEAADVGEANHSPDGVEQWLMQNWIPREQQGSFFDEYLLVEAAGLARLQKIIEALSTDFCAKALLAHPQSVRSRSSEPEPSSTELKRIYRAFCRFEIYCRVFGWTKSNSGRRNRINVADHYPCFLAKFKPWEVEEVTTVYRFIQDFYNTAFDDLGRAYKSGRPVHVEMRCIGCRRGIGLPDVFTRGGEYVFIYKQGHVSYGLEFLYKVSTTASSQARCQLLEENLSTFYPSFDEAVTGFGRISELELRRSEGAASADVDEAPFSDGEEGPKAGWAWAQHDESRHRHYNDKCREGKGGWAYMIWDRERLQRWGVLQADAAEVVSNPSIPARRTEPQLDWFGNPIP